MIICLDATIRKVNYLAYYVKSSTAKTVELFLFSLFGYYLFCTIVTGAIGILIGVRSLGDSYKSATGDVARGIAIA